MSSSEEIERKERFAFGRNWSRFSQLIDPTRISRAENSLREMLGLDSLAGLRFLDVGCGSGLFSLAARRLGARVHSFDYDSDAVATTRELRARLDPEDPDWIVEQGSALDPDYLANLGAFDVVYSWGVLHHTGRMWDAAALVADRVAPAGLLMIALYNDQGARSRFWWHVKRGYVTLPRFLQAPYAVLVIAPFELRNLIRSVWNGTFRTYLSTWTDYGQARGMSRWHDLVDWVGGYPFEVARPAEVVEFFARREFDEVRRRLTTTLGCNEFVLRRRAVCG